MTDQNWTQRPDGLPHLYCHCGKDLGSIKPGVAPQTFECAEHGVIRLAQQDV